MHWLNLQTTIFRSPEFSAARAGERATWLCLLGHCVEQENDGRLRGALAWDERRWRQLGVSLADVRRSRLLLQRDGDDITVRFYPLDKQAHVQRLRAIGTAAAAARAFPPAAHAPTASPIPPATTKSLQQSGAHTTDTTADEWHHLVTRFGLERVCAMLRNTPNTRDRWPGRIEAALERQSDHDAEAAPDALMETVTSLIDRHGWQSCRDRVGFPPDTVNTDHDLREAFAHNRAAARLLIKRLCESPVENPAAPTRAENTAHASALPAVIPAPAPVPATSQPPKSAACPQGRSIACRPTPPRAPARKSRQSA